jgi:tRNA nucleotidyltransferase/poly(A) polymerase
LTFPNLSAIVSGKMDTDIHSRLTLDEQELFAIFLKAAKSLARTPTVRVVGGWVRDKLLHQESDDIDVMLDTCTGEEFANAVALEIRSSHPHSVKVNPDKSKHLATSKLDVPVKSGKIFSVDFAMARDEVYDGDSRIPSSVSSATPEEDAQRRDITINSLFCNVTDNGVIEDFTGRGLKDLQEGMAVTPLDPMKTFSDDALRVLRVVRMAAKFDLCIDEKVFAAMEHPYVLEGVFNRISKERIGIEMSKMIAGEGVVEALRLLKLSGIFGGMLRESLRDTKYDGQMEPLDMHQLSSHHALSLWDHTVRVVMILSEKGCKNEHMMWAALCHDLGKLFREVWGDSKSCPGMRSYKGHEDESEQITRRLLEWMVLHSVVVPVCALVRNHMRPHQLIGAGAAALRRFIRQMGEEGLEWRDVMDLAEADALAKDDMVDPEVEGAYEFLKMRLERAEKSLVESGRKAEPAVLDGNEIMEALGVKPGPHMKEIVQFVKELADENPSVTKEEAKSLLKEKFGVKQ